MRNNIYLSIVASLLFLRLGAQQIDPNKSYSKIIEEKEAYFQKLSDEFGPEVLEGEGSEYREYLRWKDYWRPRISPDWSMRDHISDLGKVKFQMQQKMQGSKTATFGNIDPWHEVGPYVEPAPTVLSSVGGGNLGVGVIKGISINRLNADKMLCWSLAGGLFFTGNKGSNWVNAGSDNWNSSGCSSADFAPDNQLTFYGCSNVGGSYYNNIIGSLGGVYRTDDGGVTWNLIGDRNDFSDPNPVNNEDIIINKILIDPASANVGYLATSKGLYKNLNINSTNISLVRSSWQLQTAICSTTDWIEDVEFRTNGSGTAYITKKDQFGSWSVCKFESGVWSVLPAFTPVGAGTHNIQRLVIEVSDADPNSLFLHVNDNTCNPTCYVHIDLFRFNIPGSTWNYISSHSDQTGGVGFCVSNFNANIMYLSEWTTFKKSTDGGLTWTAIGYSGTRKFHVDVDKIITPPAACGTCASDVFLGTHGGVSYSSDNCNTLNTRSSGLGVGNGPFAPSATHAEKIVIGLDHDGTVLSSGSFNNTWIPNWCTVLDGDGQFPMIDYSDPNYVWGEGQNTVPNLSSNGGTSGWVGTNFPKNNNFGSYIVQNKTYPGTVYYPGNTNNTYLYENVWRSSTRGVGSTPEQISDFENVNIPVQGWPDNNVHSFWIFDAIYPASDPNYIYASIGINASPWYGKAYRTSNALAAASTVRSSWIELQLPSGKSNPGLMAVDASNPNIVYYAYRGFSWLYPELWRVDYTVPGSPVFKNIAGLFGSGGIPGVSITGILTERGSNGGIYVSTDVGVYYSNNAMLDFTGNNSQWQKLGTNLPNIGSHNMEINYNVNKLRIATRGRGVWEHDLYCSSFQSMGMAGPQTIDAFNEAVDQIVSTQQISSNATVNYRAGTYVQLNPGFIAAPGASDYFKAFIHPCSYPGNSSGLKLDGESGTSALMNEDEGEDEAAEVIAETRIFPNPARSELNISVELDDCEVQIFNMLGELINTRNLMKGNNKIQLTEVSDGMYICKIFHQRLLVRSEKVIIGK